MEFTRIELMKTLNDVIPGVAKSSAREQSRHFIFDGERVYSYNEMICVSHVLKTDFSCSVEASNLISIIENASGEKVNLKLEKDKLLVTSDNVKAVLATILDLRIVEILPQIPEDVAWESLPTNFLDGLKLTAFSAVHGDGTKKIHCAWIGEESISTSDDVRISHFFLNGRISNKMMLPIRWAEKMLPYKIKGYTITRGWAHFIDENHNLIFSQRMVIDEAPDIEKHFESITGESFDFPKISPSMINAVSVFTEGNEEVEKAITLHLSQPNIILKGETSKGWVEYSVEAKDWKGPEVEFKVNPNFLLQALERATTITLPEKESGVYAALFEVDNFRHLVLLPIE